MVSPQGNFARAYMNGPMAQSGVSVSTHLTSGLTRDLITSRGFSPPSSVACTSSRVMPPSFLNNALRFIQAFPGTRSGAALTRPDSTYVRAFIEDQWRLPRSLTLTPELRYEVQL